MTTDRKPAWAIRAAVLNRFPTASCHVDRDNVGPGRAWAIYYGDAGNLRRLTGGWMTPAQAWERADAAIVQQVAREHAPELQERFDTLVAERAQLYALVARVAALNPDAGEIGPGMLASLVSDARKLTKA